ncbi:MAG: recombinase family protein [Lachnospiraceae bacterium]|nr:recombinase family protein [Ruminococcus sp.]MCM1275551.1 recombinase family protein [Lachnospiraceae bacterium]
MIAIYCRKSVDKVDSTSIETQIDFCKRLITPDEGFEVYSDRGYSGSNTNRPNFQRLMSDVERGAVSKVIVYRLDRISRSVIDFANIYGKLEENNVGFYSATEQFDTSTPMGKAMLQIIMVFAELERKTIQLRIKDNFYERAKKGLFLAGKAPIGYKKIPFTIGGVKTHILEEDIETSGIVRFIYKKYLEDGSSMGQIVKYLNSPDCEFTYPKKFTNTSIMRILSNPVYVRADADVYGYLKSKGAILYDKIEQFDGVHGCTIYGRRKEKTQSKFKDLKGENIQLNLHEGLISSEDWLRVQKKMESNKSIKNSGRGKNSWLSGLIKCGYCGLAVTVVNGQRNGKRYVYCNGRKNKTCYERKSHATFDELEQAVESVLLPHIGDFRYALTERTGENNARLNELKIQQTKIDEEINSIVEKFVKANDTMLEYLNGKVNELEKRKGEIVDEILDLTAQKPLEINFKQIKEFTDNWDDLDLETKKQIARQFIKQITYKDEELNVEFFI